MKRGIFTGCLLVGVLLSGCGKTETSVRLRLYAGGGMRRAVEALSVSFHKQTGIVVDADYAGSGMLITRAQGDSAADLFMPGDVWYVDQLNEKTGNIEECITVSYFVPIIIVPKGNPKGIKGIEDLNNPALKIGVGKPKACQIGRLTAKILEKAGVTTTKENTLESLTVNELGVWVKMNNVDGAIVWDAIAANIADSVDLIEIPQEINEISTVVCGLMKTSKNKEAAKQFMQFMASPDGQAILKKMGYRTEMK